MKGLRRISSIEIDVHQIGRPFTKFERRSLSGYRHRHIQTVRGAKGARNRLRWRAAASLPRDKKGLDPRLGKLLNWLI